MKSNFKGRFSPTKLNTSFVDAWSLGHILWGMVLAWVMNPVIAMIILVLYEPIEVYILCSFMYKKFKINFGNEVWWNSAVDILFDLIGVLIGFYILRSFITPPFIF